MTLVNVSGAWVWTPGTRSASWAKFRPLRGRAVTVVPEMTSPTTAFSVWRMGLTPTTSTTSLTAPTSSFRLILAVWPASRVNGFVVIVLNPVSSARTT